MPAPSPLPQPSLKKILAYMAQYNFKPRKKLGQNFLLDRNIKDIIVKSLNLEKRKLYLKSVQALVVLLCP